MNVRKSKVLQVDIHFLAIHNGSDGNPQHDAPQMHRQAVRMRIGHLKLHWKARLKNSMTNVNANRILARIDKRLSRIQVPHIHEQIKHHERHHADRRQRQNEAQRPQVLINRNASVITARLAQNKRRSAPNRRIDQKSYHTPNRRFVVHNHVTHTHAQVRQNAAGQTAENTLGVISDLRFVNFVARRIRIHMRLAQYQPINVTSGAASAILMQAMLMQTTWTDVAGGTARYRQQKSEQQPHEHKHGHGEPLERIEDEFFDARSPRVFRKWARFVQEAVAVEVRDLHRGAHEIRDGETLQHAEDTDRVDGDAAVVAREQAEQKEQKGSLEHLLHKVSRAERLERGATLVAQRVQRQRQRDAHDEHEAGEDEVGQVQTVPDGVVEEAVLAGAVVHEDHDAQAEAA